MINKIKCLYLNLSAPVKASLWFTISSVIQKGIALLSTPIFTRLLTTEQYGVYSVYQTWYSIILIFATLNLYAGVYNNGLTKWSEDSKRFTSSLLGLSTTITLLLSLLYLANMPFWNNLLGISTFFVLAIFIQVLFEPAYNFWAAGQRYEYKYRKLVAISIFMGIASPVLGILSVCATEYKAEARVFSYVFIQVLIGLIFYVYDMKNGKTFYNKKYWKYALAFNLPLIPHYLSQTVLNQADRVMIANMVGKSEAAIYSVAYTISMMFTIVTNAINNTFIPYTYKAVRDKKIKDLKGSSNFLVLFIGLACIVAMAFGPEIIRIFASPEYYAARWVVPPVAEALFFMFVYPLFCNIEFYFEKTKIIMVASGVAAIVNIGLNYIGIKMFGYIAAAYTTLICYILLSIAHYIAYRVVAKANGFADDIYDTKFIVIIAVVSLLVMVFMTMIYDHAIIRYGVVGLICVVVIVKRKTLIEELKKIKGKA